MYSVLLSHKVVNVDIKCMKRGKCELVNVNETVLMEDIKSAKNAFRSAAFVATYCACEPVVKQTHELLGVVAKHRRSALHVCSRQQECEWQRWRICEGDIQAVGLECIHGRAASD